MAEELGFRESDISRITEIGIYESNTSIPEKHFYSIEARKVYELKLIDGSFDKIKFLDDEVAGVYLCLEDEAKELLKNDNIASGLKNTLPFYLKWKSSIN